MYSFALIYSVSQIISQSCKDFTQLFVFLLVVVNVV